MAGRSFARDTAAAKPIETGFEGLYVRNVSADVLKEFVQMAAEVTPQLEGLDESQLAEADGAKAKAILGKGLDLANDLGWYLFQHAFCDEDGDPFDDVKSAEDVAALGIIRVREAIFAFQSAVFDAGKL